MAVASVFVLALAPASLAKERTPERYSGASVAQPLATVAEVPCFIQPLKWDAALDGPVPTCTPEYGAAHIEKVVEATCFIRPLKWDAALDGPVPTCPSEHGGENIDAAVALG